MPSQAPPPEVYTLPPRVADFPEPEATFLSHGCNEAGCSSHVTRVFARDAGYCGRCPRDTCNISLGVCQVMVYEHLTLDEAEELVTLGRPRRLASGLPCAAHHGPGLPGRIVGDDQAG